MTAAKKLVLYGAGGMGREIAHLIRPQCVSGKYELLGFVVGSQHFTNGSCCGGLPVLGDDEWLIGHRDEVWCTCTIGSPAPRQMVQDRLTREGVRFETIAVDEGSIPDSASVGDGCVFYGGVVVSVDCVIEDGAMFNHGVTIGHDARVGAYTCVQPGTGISGACVIGRGVSIGGHSFIIPGRKIGDGAVLAAGSVVFTNVKPGTTVLGNPAKRMKSIE